MKKIKWKEGPKKMVKANYNGKGKTITKGVSNANKKCGTK